MDVNTKVKELEDELKVLKTEIRNVLLDVREVILERGNPLGAETESAYLRMDLRTTAQAVAAEEAARAAAGAAAGAAADAAAEAIEQSKPPEHPRQKDLVEEAEPEQQAEAELAEEAEPEPQAEDEPEEPENAEPASPPPEAEALEQASGEELMAMEPQGPENGGSSVPTGKTSRPPEWPLDATLDAAAIPPIFRAYPLLTSGTGSLAAWVAEAMAAIGPQRLERVITVYRLWGSLPPNVSQALAHLQELVRSSQEVDPPWLKIMQDMERLSSS